MSAQKRSSSPARRRSPDKPAKAVDIDLDAARKARAEQRAKSGRGVPSFKVGGERYELPAELPVEVLEGFGRAVTDEDPLAVFDALDVLLGAKRDDIIKEHELSFDDLQTLLEGAMDAYGVEAGK